MHLILLSFLQKIVNCSEEIRGMYLLSGAFIVRFYKNIKISVFRICKLTHNTEPQVSKYKREFSCFVHDLWLFLESLITEYATKGLIVVGHFLMLVAIEVLFCIVYVECLCCIYIVSLQ